MCNVPENILEHASNIKIEDSSSSNFKRVTVDFHAIDPLNILTPVSISFDTGRRSGFNEINKQLRQEVLGLGKFEA